MVDAQVAEFSVSSSINLLSDFEDSSLWTSLSMGMDSTVEVPTVLLDQVRLPSDGCLALVAGIAAGTASIVSDGSFNSESVMGPTGTSAIVLAPSTECSAKFYAKGNN